MTTFLVLLTSYVLSHFTLTITFEEIFIILISLVKNMMFQEFLNIAQGHKSSDSRVKSSSIAP